MVNNSSKESMEAYLKDIYEYGKDINGVNLVDDEDYDFSNLGITDYIYLGIGIDFRRLKRLNPKGHNIL